MRSASFRTHLLCLLFTVTLFGTCPYASAVPAARSLVQIKQPDGTLLSMVKKGDEFFHYAVSSDGYTLLPDSTGFYRYAVRNERGDLIPGPHVAAEKPTRQINATQYLSTLKPGLEFSERQRAAGIGRRIDRSLRRNVALRSAAATSLSNMLINDYPLTGSVKSLVILVEFSDTPFATNQADSTFDHLLNQNGYNVGKHIGSVADYYTYNSGGVFTPEFVVVGPIRLNRPAAYYGANDKDGNDVRPREMVREACQAVDDVVDFTQFDSNGDNIVDNVYIFYAGKGEADGGDDNTIWPHSYSLSGSYSLTLDEKKIINYACSAELDGEGALTGIGVFTHEFGHILGLHDYYDVDGTDNGGEEAFDLNSWSLMAYGSYNAAGCVPPSLTLLERYLLGWAQPTLLSVPASPTLPPLVTSNQGFIIPTDNSKEFFLLENRQQIPGTWDQYIPHHGMLAYHIDMRDNATTVVNYYGTQKVYSYEQLWSANMVNAISSHQCADIEEADNSRVSQTSSYYWTSLKADTYPGLYAINAFTDNTLPSMKNWNGTNTNKPLNRITETKENTKESAVMFDFMGGRADMGIPHAQEANRIYPFSFVATWESVDGASGYLLDVFTLDTLSGDSIKMYVSEYHNYPVTETSCVIRVPGEQSTYYYQVRSTNGFRNSDYSQIISLSTTNSKPTIRPATDVRPFQFKANWKHEQWATSYVLTVYEIDSLPGGDTIMTLIPDYQSITTSDTTFLVENTDNERTYGYHVSATDGFNTGVTSDMVLVTTPPATALALYVIDDYIHLKGIDPDSTVILYGLDGLVKQTSNESIIKAPGKGLYIAEILFKNTRKRIKILVN